jgi:hypothetical protein
MPFRCKQAFPREEKCLLDHLSPFWDFPLSVLQSFKGDITGGWMRGLSQLLVSMQKPQFLEIHKHEKHFKVSYNKESHKIEVARIYFSITE